MSAERWSALGNVYVVADSTLTRERLGPPAVRSLCAGGPAGAPADGVVEVVGHAADEADVVIWNRDGSQAELSGNGTRIAACWLGARTGAERVQIRVGSRTVEARVRDGAAETDLGPVSVGDREHVAGVELVRVDVGNPHAVVRSDPADVGRLGPLLVGHPAFPAGTNVEVVRIEDLGAVSARVWERGVGETPSSGTGAVAAAAATHRNGDVAVRFPGGTLHVRLARGRAWVSGPAVREQPAHN